MVSGAVAARGMEEMVRWVSRDGGVRVGGEGEGGEGAKGEFWGCGGGLLDSLAALSSQAARAVWSTGQAEGGGSLREEDMLCIDGDEMRL